MDLHNKSCAGRLKELEDEVTDSISEDEVTDSISEDEVTDRISEHNYAPNPVDKSATKTINQRQRHTALFQNATCVKFRCAR